MAKKILIIMGTRPEAIKLAPLFLALNKEKNVICKICLTSQHKSMLKNMTNLFGLKPSYDLNVMRYNQNLTELIERILKGLRKIKEKFTPDIIIVQGDTTTAIASSLYASMNKIKLAHIEAGLRSFDKNSPWPEEINRKLISQLSDLNFCPTIRDYRNLTRENISNNFIHGNTIVDSVDFIKKNVIPKKIDYLNKKFNIYLKNNLKIFCTIHRRENFGNNLKAILEAIIHLSNKYNISFLIPVHPNPNVKKTIYSKLNKHKNITLSKPITYDESIFLIDNSDLIMSDSGGIQEEASILKKKIIILRDKTERQDVLKDFGILVGSNKKLIIKHTLNNINNTKKLKRIKSPFGKIGLSNIIAKTIIKLI